MSSSLRPSYSGTLFNVDRLAPFIDHLSPARGLSLAEKKATSLPFQHLANPLPASGCHACHACEARRPRALASAR